MFLKSWLHQDNRDEARMECFRHRSHLKREQVTGMKQMGSHFMKVDGRSQIEKDTISSSYCNTTEYLGVLCTRDSVLAKLL